MGGSGRHTKSVLSVRFLGRKRLHAKRLSRSMGIILSILKIMLERFSKRISVMRWERRGLESRPPVGTIATSFTYLQWPGNTQCNAQTVAQSRLLPREANIHRATEGVVADFLNLAGSEQFTSIFLQPFEPCLRADLVRTLRQHLPVGQLDIKIGESHGAICKA